MLALRFSVVASALGIQSLLPFLKAVCQSKKSWQARHTGIKIVQQIAILMGCAVLPQLTSLVEIIAHGLDDEQQKVSMQSFMYSTLNILARFERLQLCRLQLSPKPPHPMESSRLIQFCSHFGKAFRSIVAKRLLLF